MKSPSTGRGELLWEPSAEMVERARLTEFMRWLEAERGLRLQSYDELWRWSVDDLDAFWGAIWDFFDVQADGEPTPVLGEREMPGAEWFPGTRLNYAEHVFRDRDDAETAILHASELRELSELSWGELAAQVAAVAAGLRELGVEKGDRVVAYMPNVPETIVAFLATASIGAVWSSCSPDFGIGQRRRPLRPDRAQGPLRSRWLPLRRQGLRPARHPDAAPGGDAEPRAHRRPPLPRSRPRPLPPARRDALGGAALLRRGRRAQPSSASPSTTRSGSSTPPARPACRRRSSRARAASCSST